MQGGSYSRELGRVTVAVAGVLAFLIAIGLAMAPGQAPSAMNEALARYLLVRQDLVVGIAVVAALLLFAWRADVAQRGFPTPRPRTIAVVMAIAMPLLCWAGAQIIFDRYDFSRDEQMASFDAIIFASGRLFATFPVGARDTATIFNQTFILPIGNHEAWVSSYLPMNAAIRAIFLRLGDATLTAPFFVGLGAIALWRIGARLWPQSPGSQVAALLLYAGSSQIWITGMTSYAMSAHLGLDLLWLWLFLKDRPWARAAAIAVGFVATGLHQPLFHPLFVLPFLAMLASEKRWRELALYCVAYAAIGLFWMGWPIWISAHGSPLGVAPGGVGFIDRFRVATGLRAWGIGVMAANLVRFIAWQHLLLLPLAGYGMYRCWNADPIARALALGLILPIAVLLILLPYQGHGWGYRYLHGVIGSACLLGGYGWRHLEERRRAPVVAMAVATMASLAVLLPVHAVMAHRMVAPVARIAAARDATKADFMVVDDLAAPFALDLVINRPDLDNRPLVLAGQGLVPGEIAGLCRRGAITFLDAAHLRGLSMAFGGASPQPTPDYVRLEEAARAAGCRVVGLPN
jgi:uncharacterized membrane protein (UPF0136 family)